MKKCEPWAIARCPDSKACGDHVFTDGSDCDKFNQRICNQLPTNADRIRSMSDVELAKFIGAVATRDWEFRSLYGCYSTALDWLRQPAEEENP